MVEVKSISGLARFGQVLLSWVSNQVAAIQAGQLLRGYIETGVFDGLF